jgi:hypothetical protein
MLADHRGRAVDRCGRVAQLRRRCDDLHVTGAWMVVACDRLHMLDLRVFGGRDMGFHLAAPDVDGEHRFDQLGGRPFLGQGRELLPDLVPLFEQRGRIVVSKKGVVAKHADQLAIGALMAMVTQPSEVG